MTRISNKNVSKEAGCHTVVPNVQTHITRMSLAPRCFDCFYFLLFIFLSVRSAPVVYPNAAFGASFLVRAAEQ